MLHPPHNWRRFALHVVVTAAILFLIAAFVAYGMGCSGAAHTDIGPAASSVKSKTKESRPSSVETQKLTVTTPVPQPQPPATYRLHITTSQGASPCGPVVLPSR